MMQCRAQFGSPLLRGILLSSISRLNAFQSYVGAALPKQNNEVFFCASSCANTCNFTAMCPSFDHSRSLDVPLAPVIDREHSLKSNSTHWCEGSGI